MDHTLRPERVAKYDLWLAQSLTGTLRQVFDTISTHFSGVEKLETVGDAYMIAVGPDVSLTNAPQICANLDGILKHASFWN